MHKYWHKWLEIHSCNLELKVVSIIFTSKVPFLSSFLETQIFASFIDEATMRMTSEVIEETPFDTRLIAIKEKFGESLVRTPTYAFCETIKISDEV